MFMWVSVEDMKKHLNIDAEFTDDDALIESLIEVAEDVVAKHIDIDGCNLGCLAEQNGGMLPPSVLHSIKLYVGNLYANRESVSFNGNPTEIPFSFDYLIGLNKTYR